MYQSRPGTNPFFHLKVRKRDVFTLGHVMRISFQGSKHHVKSSLWCEQTPPANLLVLNGLD